MTTRLGRLWDKARTLESALASRVEGAARALTQSTTRQPLEIVHAVVERVERELQPAGRGRVVFPFTQIRVVLVAASPRDRARVEVACEGPPTLSQRILDRLRTAGCETSPAVSLAFVSSPHSNWTEPDFDVEFTRGPVDVDDAPPLTIDLVVTNGTTPQPSYTFTATPIALGRGAEVRDGRERLLRTNHVAFADTDDEINRSVSRRHARIDRDVDGRAFRLFDDGSTLGTSVLRNGRGLPIPHGGKGLRLQPDDEIVLGQARLRVDIQ